MLGYVLINESSDKAITPEVMTKIATALARQQVELAEWWQRVPLQVVLADSEAAAPKEEGWTLARLVDVLDDKDALAYHTTVNGRPTMFMGVQIIKSNATGDWLFGKEGLCATTAHEFNETTINPYCEDYWPLDVQTWIPKEVSDPVQGDAYELDEGSGVFVANFVGPRYFSSSVGPFDRMRLVDGPGKLRPGGYQSRSQGSPSSPSTNVFGALPEHGGMPEWKRNAKSRPGSRSSRVAHRRPR